MSSLTLTSSTILPHFSTHQPPCHLVSIPRPRLAEADILPASFIPPSPTGGVLPYWMLLISSAAFYNVAQSYVVLWQTKEIYGKKPEQGKFDFRSS